jgi:L-aspartate oxidase
VDFEKQPAPVAPAAHYAMGGVHTDLDGRTTIPRLFAAGEVASTGVHGANRLASNSLLEGVVFGTRAGRAMRESAAALGTASPVPEPEGGGRGSAEQTQRVAWERCGIVRDATGLREACELLARPSPPEGSEARNMREVALLIARCALARQESRGAHFRTDYPAKRAEFAKHSVVRKDAEIVFR